MFFALCLSLAQIISLVEYGYCSMRSCMTGKSVKYSGGCHGEACAIGGKQQQKLVDGSNCSGNGCSKLQEKPAIAEGRPVLVAEGKVAMAQPII